MYTVKNSGRSHIMFFDSEAEEQLINSRKHLELVELGLANNEFILYYQPKIHLQTSQIVGLEALLRWQHPSLGTLIPESFQQSLEHKYLGITIGNWVLKEALAQMSYWCSLGYQLKVSVNIAAHHLQQKDFVTQLEHLLNEVENVPPHLLELEILESVAISDFSNVANVINQCHALGVSIALDDFGTGYSSLTYLRQLSLDTLKIDKSFVINMLSNENDCAIVASVIGLSKNFNRTVIAEGVESPSHINRLMEMGCDCGQGYGIAYPMPNTEIIDWVNTHAIT
jgi:diguanylate cyclase